MKAQLSRLTFALVAGALIASCASATTGSAPVSESEAAKPVVHVHLSYAEGYDTVSGARAAADAVVIGTVNKLRRTEESKATPGTVISLFDVSIQRVIKGDVGDSIVVKQDGGELADLIAVIDDDPLLKPHATYIMFLKIVENGPYAGQYFMLGGPSGRLQVAADRSLSKVGGGILKVPAGTVDDIR